MRDVFHFHLWVDGGSKTYLKKFLSKYMYFFQASEILPEMSSFEVIFRHWEKWFNVTIGSEYVIVFTHILLFLTDVRGRTVQCGKRYVGAHYKIRQRRYGTSKSVPDDRVLDLKMREVFVSGQFYCRCWIMLPQSVSVALKYILIRRTDPFKPAGLPKREIYERLG